MTESDPNETLAKAREALDEYEHAAENSTLIEVADRLAKAFMLLDEHLSTNGALPDDWRRRVPDYGVSPAIDQMLHSVFIAAMEGGTGYWSKASEYRWSLDRGHTDDLEGFYAVIEDSEPLPKPDFPPDTRIDRAVIARGIERYLNGYSYSKNSRMRALALELVTNPTDADFDADDADCIVQVGLFGELVYG